MEPVAQREATQPTLVAQEETPPPVVGVRVKDTEHETETAAAAVQLVATQPEVFAPGGRMDYDKLVDLFGCERIDAALVHRISRLTFRPPHRFLRRGVFFAHRDLDRVLDLHEAGEKFYMFTGREPSPEPLQLGDLIPFVFTKYLQDAFKVPVVIQLSDDASFLRNNNLTVAECKRLAREDAKDIIACGFDIQRTFIFTNTNYITGALYETTAKVAKHVKCDDSMGICRISTEDNIGKSSIPAEEAAPSFPSSFPHLFPRDDPPRCLIPCSIYKDPFFRMVRGVAAQIGCQKPSLIESKAFPALHGEESFKMSSGSNPNSVIYVTDSPKQIKAKVNRYAFSGGQSSVELHRKLGANLDVDVPIKYLELFLEDDDEFEQIKKEYKEGRMLTGEVKQCLIAAVSEIVCRHQTARAQVTEEMVDAFMVVRPLPNMFS